MTEQEYKKHIYAKAEEVKNQDDFNAIYKEIEEYHHGYGTIVYACFAIMLAAFNMLNRGKYGGITGFQAGCIGWEAIRKFMMVKEDASLKLIDYSDMLYPQYEEKFDKVITKSIWEDLQKKANDNIENHQKNAHPDVIEHWKSIANGQVPFGYTVKN